MKQPGTWHRTGWGWQGGHHSWSVRPPFLAHVLAASHVSVTTESNTGSENRHISGWQQALSTGQLQASRLNLPSLSFPIC